MAERVWTTSRKWVGNLVPAFVYLPLAFTGAILIIVRGEFIGSGLWFLIAAVVAGWLAMNFLALTGNGFLKRQLRRELGDVQPLDDRAIFVGYARPEYRSALDPHEDLGFLILAREQLLFVGETYRLAAKRSSITNVGFRINPHTLLGLGRWIAVECTVEGRKTRLLFEPRERQTLVGNLQYGARAFEPLMAGSTGQ